VLNQNSTRETNRAAFSQISKMVRYVFEFVNNRCLQNIEFDVFVSDRLHLEPSVYAMWLKGLSVDEIVSERSKDRKSAYITSTADTFIVRQQVDTICVLEHFLQQGALFQFQSLYELDLKEQRKLCGWYYHVADVAFRELVGRVSRSQCAVIAERCGVPLSVCERNYDNFKRVQDALESAIESKKDPIRSLKRQFRISNALSLKYFRAAFVAYHKWDLAKKKLAFLTFGDVEQIAGVLIERWTAKPYTFLELDTTLRRVVRLPGTSPFGTSRLLKAYVHKVVSQLRECVSAPRLARLDAKFALFIVKPLLHVASDLSSSKQARARACVCQRS
jgi:hypothetical protein